MSHPLCYTIRIKEIKNMKNKNENTNEITFEGWHSDEKETFIGCDTITGPDGKEYPIKDRD
jgi:hypothetical protein